MKHVLAFAGLLGCLSGFGQMKPPERATGIYTSQVKPLLDSADGLRYRDTAAFFSVLEKAMQLARQANDARAMAAILQKKAILLPTGASLPLLARALELAREARDTQLQVNLNNDFGFRYVGMAQYPRALDHYFASLKLLERRPNLRSMEFVLSSIGGIYLQINDPKSVEYLEKAIRLRGERVDSVRLTNDLMALGLAYNSFGDPLRAIDYMERSVRWCRKGDLARNAAFGLFNLCQFYSSLTPAQARTAGWTQKEVDDRLFRCLDQIDELNTGMKDPNLGYARPFYTAQHEQRLKNYEPALALYREAHRMVNEAGLLHYRELLYMDLSANFAALNHFDSAYYYFRAGIALKDSARLNDAITEVTRKQVEFEFSRIQDSLQQIQLITDEQLKQQKLLALQQQQALVLKQALLNLSRQQQANADLAYQKANADLLLNQGLVQEKEKLLTIAEQRRQLQATEAQLRRSQLLAAEKELRAQKRQQLFLLAGIMLLIGVFFLLFRNYRNKQKARALLDAERIKTQKAEAIRKMAEFEMHGLRAQLNPHFMFNSLNAIQEQILREDTENAGIYLTTFARMLRQLLENAEYSFVPLAKELEFLRLYLSMEQLRIPELQFQIETDAQIDTAHAMIPNMILQPYLENAVWHGLSPRKGDKCIRLTVSAVAEGLRIAIEDNGIGRRKAAELQSRYRKAHRSKGMELLQKRFELIRKEFGSRIRVEVQDLQEEGEATGTRVVLTLPESLTEGQRSPSFAQIFAEEPANN